MPKASQAGVRRALDQEQLVLFYQPIHDAVSRAIVATEALLRAQRGNGEIRSGEPIAAGAEEGPDLFRLDSWTVHRAVADAARWQTGAAPDVRLHVNLSPREFENRGVAARLKKLFTTCGADPSKITLEITETHHIIDIGQTRRVLEELKETGVQLWADDFGTGHSSLSHLLQFPLDGLKLPGAFIGEVAANGRAAAMVRSLVALAHELDMKAVAEGVENEGQLAMLRDCECDYIQGFLFSRPMPLDAFEEELARSSRQ
jgi:EAL domain-containing protein (putative c-di-GMP-specific phosphodiesterase class I)